MGVKTVEQGRTVVLNQILRVAVRAARPLDQVRATGTHPVLARWAIRVLMS